MGGATTTSAKSSNSLAGALAALALALAAAGAGGGDEDALARGEYLVRAGGCIACHTDIAGNGAPLAGGGKVESPFGVFYGPNLTPHPEHGIGGWSEADFVRAMSFGIGPTGAPYYPAFPYPAYSGVARADLSDMWRYLRSLAPVDRADRAHELEFPFAFRPLVLGWQFLFFAPERWTPDESRSNRWNRGAYLSRHLLHCGECHTGRNALGGFVAGLDFAGHRGAGGLDGAPNITPHETGIADWSAGDMTWLLRTGFTPSGDDVQGSMAALVRHGSSFLADDDLAAVAEFILSLPPIENRVRGETESPAPADDEPADDEYDYDF